MIGSRNRTVNKRFDALFFALFNIMNVAFVLSAIGANLVWIFTGFCSGQGFGGRNFCCFRRSQHRDAWIHTSSALEDPSTPTVVLGECLPANPIRRSSAQAGLVF